MVNSSYGPGEKSDTVKQVIAEHRRRERLSIDMAAMIRLQAVSTRFVSRNNREDAYSDIVETAITIAGADMGELQLLTEFNRLSIVAHSGFGQPFLNFFHSVQPGQSAGGTALKLRRRVIIEDIADNPVFAGTPDLEVMLAAGVRAVQSTPLVGRSGYLLGVLSTYYRTVRRPDERDLHLMDLLASQAADIIERIQAEAYQMNMTHRLRLLSQAASLLLVSDAPEQLIQPLSEQIMPHLDCEVFLNFVPYVAGNCLRLNAYAGISAEAVREIAMLDYGKEVCGNVALTGQRIIREAIQDSDDCQVRWVKSIGLRAFACHPFIFPSGTLLGTLAFGTRLRDSFNEDDLAMMQTLADQIAVALQRRQAERDLRRINSELEERVAGRTRELEAINSELKAYANIVAHDFRTPMVNLKGFSDELSESLGELKGLLQEHDGLLPAELKDRIEQLLTREMTESLLYIGASVDKLDRMINALLKLSRLGRRESSSEETDVSKLLHTVLLSYRRTIDAQGVEIEVTPLPKVDADYLALEQIFGNLIDNAVKYLDAARPGVIRITCCQSETEYVFAVQDNGCGIAEQDQEKIFEIFRRAGRQDLPGEGMGLAYVRTLVRQLGGKVWCESELGVGTTMSFTIPKTC